VTFDLLGRFAYPDTGDVIDTKSKQIVAEWKDDRGGRIRSSKFIEVHIKDGEVIRVGDQFGIGRVGIGTGPINQPAGTTEPKSP
jgi:hypothetical protein